MKQVILILSYDHIQAQFEIRSLVEEVNGNVMEAQKNSTWCKMARVTGSGSVNMAVPSQLVRDRFPNIDEEIFQYVEGKKDIKELEHPCDTLRTLIYWN